MAARLVDWTAMHLECLMADEKVAEMVQILAVYSAVQLVARTASTTVGD